MKTARLTQQVLQMTGRPETQVTSGAGQRRGVMGGVSCAYCHIETEVPIRVMRYYL
jgi:hypothetical protein